MIALAALTGTVVALALSGGPRLPSSSPARATPTEGASASPSASASVSPSPSPSVSASPTPSASATAAPSATPGDPLAALQPLVFAWHPADTTLIVEEHAAGKITLVAVPVDGSPTTPLVTLPEKASWAIRRDGSAVAVALDTGSVTTPRLRIAALNLQTGARGWVTPLEPTLSQRSPVWSLDGSVIYYAKSELDGVTDLGVYRIRTDGSNLTQLRPPTDRVADPVGLTPDGLHLVLSKVQAGGSVDVLDLTTRQTRTFGNVGAAVQAWRTARPRALVSTGGPAGGLGQLFLWDDLAPSASPATVVAQLGIAGADWDPTGTKVAVAMPATAAGGTPQLVTMDPNGQNRAPIAGTEGAVTPVWLRAGIAYLWRSEFALPTEIRLADPGGAGGPRVLYKSDGLVRLTFVSP